MIEKIVYDGTLSEEQKKEIQEAAKQPSVYDENCPKPSDEQLKELKPWYLVDHKEKDSAHNRRAAAFRRKLGIE